MKALKTLGLVIAPMVFGLAVAAVAMLSHEKVLVFLLGHELNLEGSVLDALWLRIADFLVVWQFWQRVLWPQEDKDGAYYQIAQIRVGKLAAWIAGISSVVWAVLLVAARLCWSGPLGWLLDGAFIAMTRPWIIFVMLLVLTAALQIAYVYTRTIVPDQDL